MSLSELLTEEFNRQNKSVARLREIGLDACELGEKLNTALLALVNKLIEVENSSSYQAVWSSAWAHGVVYIGPTYEKELKVAKELLGIE